MASKSFSDNDVDYPIITFQAPGRTFDRLLKERSLSDLKETVRKKLGLGSGSMIQFAQLRNGQLVDLEDEDDFDAFRVVAYKQCHANVQVVLTEYTVVEDSNVDAKGSISPLPPMQANVLPGTGYLNANSSAFVPGGATPHKTIVPKNEESIEVNLETLKTKVSPTLLTSWVTARQYLPTTPTRKKAPIRIETPEQRQKRLEEEEQKEKEAKAKTSAEERARREEGEEQRRQEEERKKNEEETRKRREQEEIERLKKEKEEKERLRKDEEKMERLRREEEEEERSRKDDEVKELRRKEEEQKEKERLQCEEEEKRLREQEEQNRFAEEKAREEEERRKVEENNASPSQVMSSSRLEAHHSAMPPSPPPVSTQIQPQVPWPGYYYGAEHYMQTYPGYWQPQMSPTTPPSHQRPPSGPHTSGVHMSPRTHPPPLQSAGAPTLSHAPVSRPPSSNMSRMSSPPPTPASVLPGGRLGIHSSTFVPGGHKKVVLKNEDGTEVNLEALTTKVSQILPTMSTRKTAPIRIETPEQRLKRLEEEEQGGRGGGSNLRISNTPAWSETRDMVLGTVVHDQLTLGQ